jgi:hypothetical protein
MILTDDRDRVLGQTITFAATRNDRSQPTVKTTSAMNTIKKIAAKKGGGVKNARAIADYNGITSILSKMKSGRTVKLPWYVVQDTSIEVDVLAGDRPPRITGGYAKWEPLDRWGRVGISQFTGFDPVTMEIPVRFRATSRTPGGVPEGADVESAITTLEQMAGRGNFPGAGFGRPAKVKITTTGARAENVPLVPNIYQSSGKLNDFPPTWVISDIDWDDSPWRNPQGNRIDQQATVTVMQFVTPR